MELIHRYDCYYCEHFFPYYHCSVHACFGKDVHIVDKCFLVCDSFIPHVNVVQLSLFDNDSLL